MPSTHNSLDTVPVESHALTVDVPPPSPAPVDLAHDDDVAAYEKSVRSSPLFTAVPRARATQRWTTLSAYTLADQRRVADVKRALAETEASADDPVQTAVRTWETVLRSTPHARGVHFHNEMSRIATAHGLDLERTTQPTNDALVADTKRVLGLFRRAELRASQIHAPTTEEDATRQGKKTNDDDPTAAATGLGPRRRERAGWTTRARAVFQAS